MVSVPANSVPVTVPLVLICPEPASKLPTVALPTALSPPLLVQTFAVLLYKKVRNDEPIGPASIPAPLAAELLIALLAKLIVKSFVLTTLELMVVVLPVTCKLP